MTDVYTDGACRGNPGRGGWAWVVPNGPWGSGSAPRTTNQRMEVQAVLEALRALACPLRIFSDSTYVVNCFRDQWYVNWLRKDWQNSQRRPVSNQDLWKPLVSLYLDREHEIEFKWVRGHSGDVWNDRADELATKAADSQSPTTVLNPLNSGFVTSRRDGHSSPSGTSP